MQSSAQSYSLTDRQRLVWVSQQLHPEIPLYHVAFSFRIREPLDSVRFGSAFQRVVDSTDALRTVIRNGPDAAPLACVLDDVPEGLQFISSPGGPGSQEQAAGFLDAHIWQPFDLEKCLFRSWLVELGPQDFLWVLVVHHIVTDTESIRLIYERLRSAYVQPGLLQKHPGFRDYAGSDDARPEPQAAAYWAAKLAEADPDFTFYGGIPSGHAHRMSRFSRRFELSRFEAIDAGRDPRISLNAQRFNFFASLYAIYLARLGDTTDPMVSMVYHGRGGRAGRDVAGFFVQMLPLHIPISVADSLPALMERVSRTAVEARRHSRHTIANSLEKTFMHASLNLQVASFSPFLDRPVEVTWHTSGWNEHSLVLNVHPFSRDSLEVQLDISKDLLDEASRQTAAERFWLLLEWLLDKPGSSLAEAPLMSPAERQKILQTWNGPDLPGDCCGLVDQFEEQAACHPDRTAFIFEGDSLDYQGLRSRSNRLAQHLLSLETASESAVAICIDTGLRTPETILAVLKTGRPFLMLPPDLPENRRNTMLSDCEVHLAVTFERWMPLFDGFDGRVACLDRDAGAIAECPDVGTGLRLGLDDPAYIAYTSGSTGKAKGAIVPQRQLLNMLAAKQARYPIGPLDVLCHKSYLGFVDSTIELFEGLLRGAPTVMLPPDAVVDPARLVEAFERHGITVTRFLSEHLHTLIDTLPEMGARLPALRLVTNTAAPIRPADLKAFRRVFPQTTFVNTYGLSEVLSVTLGEINPADEHRGRLPIGTPIPNRRVYILDRFGLPVPPGVPGELYAGGQDLAIEYANRPDENRYHFHPDPFLTGSRMFRTGDLACWREDGRIDHLGRRDHQVKIRGYRVELGEIESTLHDHPDVKDAVVVAGETTGQGTTLVAYLVMQPGSTAPVSELRCYARERLIEPMVPAHFEQIEALPLTASGKIDRLALPVPQAWSRAGQGFVAPRTALERQLAAIWEAVLDVRPVGIRQAFFGLGGNSLLAIRMFAQVAEKIGVKLPVSSLLQHPTIEALAGQIDSQGPDNWPTVVDIQPEGDLPPFFCVHGFGGGVVGYTELARLMGRGRPFFGLQARGLDGVEVPHANIEEMAAFYIDSMRKVQPGGPYFLGGYCFGGVVAFEMARQLEAVGETVQLVAILEGFAPLDRSQKEGWWRPRSVLIFVRNMPFWLADFVGLGFSPMAARLRRKLQAGVRTLRTWLGLPVRVDLEAIIEDVSGIPREHRHLMEVHIQALSRYRPSPRDCRATLFRVEGQPLFGFHEADNGWGRLALAGVDVIMVEGSHRNILEPPNVASLAEKLNRALESAARQNM